MFSRPAGQSKGNAAPDRPRFEYKALVANKISTIRKELEDAAAQGYELRGLTANASIMPFTVSETIAVMERESGQAKQKYEYRFLTADREEALQKELDASVSEGFHPVAMSVNRDNNAASIVFGLPALRYDLDQSFTTNRRNYEIRDNRPYLRAPVCGANRLSFRSGETATG